MDKEPQPTKVIYRIQVGDKFTEVDHPVDLSAVIRALVGGHDKLIKRAVAPEDIHITLHSAPADPEMPNWKTLESPKKAGK